MGMLPRLRAVVAAVPVTLVVKDLLVDVVFTDGPSMQPTLNPQPDAETLRKYYFSRYWKDVVLVDKFSPRSGKFERGSVVLVKSAEDPTRYIIKRLVGLEGDWVINKKGDYVHVQKGHCWIEGDNIENSIDSNAFGTIPLALVLARVTHVIWPPWRFQAITTEDPNAKKKEPKIHARPYQFESIGIEQIVDESDETRVKDEHETREISDEELERLIKEIESETKQRLENEDTGSDSDVGEEVLESNNLDTTKRRLSNEEKTLQRDPRGAMDGLEEHAQSAIESIEGDAITNLDVVK